MAAIPMWWGVTRTVMPLFTSVMHRATGAITGAKVAPEMPHRRVTCALSVDSASACRFPPRLLPGRY